MTPIRCFAALLLTGSSLAWAAPPAYLTIDGSGGGLMDQATAHAMWKQKTPLKMFRLYPEKKWGFVSEVEGGFDDAKVCVITARAMMLPRSGNTLIYRPVKIATAFGTQAGASAEQCKALGRAKLGEAIASVSASLLGS